jgi:type I restriction enzyme S subunit
MGVLVDRTHRELTDEEIDRISRIYRSWSGSLSDDTYADVPGLCRSATLEEVASHDHTLNPGRFISGQAELGEGLEQLLGRAASSVSELSERLPLSLRRIRMLVVEDLPNELKDGSLDQADLGVLSDVARLQREIVEPELHADEIFDHFSLPAFDLGESPVREAGRNIQSNKFLVLANSILVSRLNPRIRRVWWPEVSPDHRAIASTEFAVLVPKPPCTREYLYALVSTNWFQAVLCSRVTGTSGSHQRVRPPDLMTIPVPLPNPTRIAAVTGMMQPIFDRLIDQRHEAHLLKNLRDEILPRLVPDPTSDRTAPARAGRTTQGDAIGDDITLDLGGPRLS